MCDVKINLAVFHLVTLVKLWGAVKLNTALPSTSLGSSWFMSTYKFGVFSFETLSDSLEPNLDLHILYADARMECCEVEPRYTIEQIDLLQRLRLSGMTKPQIIHALESLERLDPDHHASLCDSHPAPSNNTPTTAAPAPSSSSSSSSSLSLASATTQTSGLDGAALSPSNSYEASPPPLYPPSVAVQRSFSYDMMGEEEWDLEEKVEEYMR